MNKIEQYSIRELSEISGVNAVTLRAWERRYGLLKPSRTEKGHRYYTQADVELVRNILIWLDRGVAISKVKPLIGATSTTDAVIDDSNSHWQEAINHSLTLVSSFQRERLEQQINELFGNYPLDTLSSNYLYPLQEAIDRQAALRFGGNAEKVFFDSELHSDLLSRIRHANNNNNGPRLLLLALDGQKHGIKALLLALALLEAGYRIHLLLDPCQLREIAYIIEQASGQSPLSAVLCHSDSKPDQTALEQELMRAATHARVPFFLSGDWLNIYPALHDLEGIIPLEHNLRSAVIGINNALRRAT